MCAVGRIHDARGIVAKGAFDIALASFESYSFTT
jgi:hypothetical protein